MIAITEHSLSAQKAVIIGKGCGEKLTVLWVEVEGFVKDPALAFLPDGLSPA